MENCGPVGRIQPTLPFIIENGKLHHKIVNCLLAINLYRFCIDNLRCLRVLKISTNNLITD